MNKSVIAALVGVAALALVGVGAYVASQPPARRPNVIIVLWDTVRADRLSMYGYELDTTPRMKAWADAHGVVYENAMSPGMWTVPSHASLFTGLAPSTHGAGFDHRWLDDGNVTLAEWFGQNGWETYAFSANPNLSPNRVNLLQGFDNIDTSWSRKWKAKVVEHTKQKLIRKDKSTEISPGSKQKHAGTGFYNAAPITHEALTRWLDTREDPERPFFAYLSYMEAHKPRVPTLDARKKTADDDTIRLGLETDLTFKSQLLYSYDRKSYTPEELEAVNRVYDASLVDLDDPTADLLDDLEARGILDDTIVVFTADHGEQLGEHQQFGHRSGVYQALVHVPLVIAYPRKLRPARVSTPVTNLQVYDTLLELAGLPKPEGDFVRGNLTRLSSLAATPVFSESISIDRLGFTKVKKMFPELTRDVWANKFRTVSDGKWKLIQSVDFDTDEIVKHELYHLAEDPNENVDVASANPDKVRELDAAMAEWRGGLRKWDPAKGDQVADEELSDAAKKQLALLGYLEEDEEDDGQAPPPAGDPDEEEEGVTAP